MDSSPTLGKRKERDEDAHGATLFVSSLPYTATSVDLQTLFSDIAPVRSAFIVTQPGTGVSKGVGYVAFAIKEDAQAAFDKISKEGITLAGRNLRVQWADQKPKEGAEPPVKRTVKEPTLPRPRAPQNPLAIRTIVVNGIPSSVDSKATLWKKFRKYSGAESVEWPVEGSAAHVVFATSAAANAAIDKLHAHVYKGSLLSVTLKKRLDTLSNNSSSKPSHASRLIIRNIPFHTTEQDLRSVFLPYGPIHSVHIPKNKDNGRMRGFAFVWMLSKKDAEVAMEACNGITIRPGLAESKASDMQKKKKQRRLEKKSQQGQAAETEDGDEKTGDEPVERAIAVDWALSKDKWEEEKTRAGLEEEGSESGSESDADSDGSNSHLGVHDGNADSDGSDDDEEERDEEPVKPALPATDVGTTLFIRNIPFEATEDELRVLFRQFGRLRYARITVDPHSGRSRGTGFACFWEKEEADSVIQQSDLLRAEMTGSEVVVKKNPFVLPSILTPDPSSSLARSLVLHGRTLDVVRAVTRDVASKLKEDGERKREKADKRNMYLLREGVILPNSPAAQTMVPAELERRSGSFNARRTLLNSNPSLYVSKTRLSVRQIPLFVSEKVLKRLALHAVREFESDVKKGTRTGLTEDERLVDVDLREGDDGGKKKKQPRDRVKQSKLVRQQERVDPVTGRGRSKGYGFIEMYSHSDALRVLRWANNNAAVAPLLAEWSKMESIARLSAEKGKKPEEREEGRLKRMQDALEKGPGPVKGTLIVEFSIENVQVVQRRTAQQTAGDKPDKGKKDVKRKKEVDVEEESAEEEPRPAKKVKADDAVKTPGSNMGGLIGRKRKERKAKK